MDKSHVSEAGAQSTNSTLKQHGTELFLHDHRHDHRLVQIAAIHKVQLVLICLSL